jgi:predicted nucleic acid-binding protein
MSIGDSIIASSAKVFGGNLYTNNIEDFGKIKDLKIINPIKR